MNSRQTKIFSLARGIVETVAERERSWKVSTASIYSLHVNLSIMLLSQDLHKKSFTMPFHISNTMNIPEAEAALDKQWNELKNVPAWDFKEARASAEVVQTARTKKTHVLFASLMHLCHLKRAQPARHPKKQNGRAALWERQRKMRCVSKQP